MGKPNRRKAEDVADEVVPITVAPPQAAAMLGVDEGTLAQWRSKTNRGMPCGPAFVRYGQGSRGRVLYKVKDLQRWVDALPVTSGETPR